MRRTLLLALTALTLTGGVAAADRFHGGGRGPAVRDHRGAPARVNGGFSGNVRVSRGTPARYRDYNRGNYRVVRVNRSRPVFRNNGFYFAGGLYRPYRRPVFNVRYTNYYARPQPVVESYDAVPGYLWIAGQWQWNGYEWNWISGHYEIDNAYQDNYTDGSVYYDYGY